MKNKDLIEKLKEFNPEAEVVAVAHNYPHKFSLAWGSTDGEGVTKEKTTTISLYVDELCQNETAP